MAFIGIRPVIDGREGEHGIRESLEEQTMWMAKAAAELISGSLKDRSGSPVECVIADSTIGGVAEAAACAEKFAKAGVCATLTVTPCWCYGGETMDMDKTLEWFRNVLGWHGTVDERSENGQGLYGCVHDPVGGFHLFAGEPVKGWACLTMVDGLDALHKLVKKNGWEQISDITPQPWGAKECRVTTPDGCVLRFFESI
jgi:predicted enzyme related to lactoylglutathione lyase